MPPFASLLPLLLLAAPFAWAFYVPGISPTVYHDGYPVALFVNKIFSDKAQLPFAYADLPFVCKPEGEVRRTWLNLGEVLRGDRIMSSGYKVCKRPY